MNRVFRLGPTRNTKASKFQPSIAPSIYYSSCSSLSLSQFSVESHFNRFEALSVSPIEVASEARISLHYSHFNFLIMSDEEPVDPKREIEESICKPKCVKPLLDYQACVKRIKDDESGHKHCTGQYFDYWSCIDKCVAPKLFAKLK